MNIIDPFVLYHPKTENCEDPECEVCGARDCPYGDPLHYHHQGCPSCRWAEVLRCRALVWGGHAQLR